MRNRSIEYLESRLLFATITVQPSQTLDTVNTLSIREAITQIGSGDFLSVYNTSNSLSGIIVDATGTVVVPKFTIANFQPSPNSIFSNVVAASLPNGNADVAYTIFNPDGQTFRDVGLITQISPNGAVVDPPTLIDSSTTDSQTQAAIAVAPDGTAAVSFTDSAGVGGANTNIFVRTFNSSLVPNGPSLQVSATNANSSVFQDRSNSSVVYNTQAGGFDVAWYQQTLTPQFATAGQEIDGNQITGAGDFNGDGTADVLVTGNTHDTLGQPYLVNNPGGVSLFYAVEGFTPSPAFTFTGSGIFAQPLTAGLVPIGSPTSLLTTVPNAECVIGSVVGVGDFNGDGFSDLVFCDSGQNGGNGLVGDSDRVIVYRSTDGGKTFAVASDTTTAVQSGVTDPLAAFPGTVSGTANGFIISSVATGTTGSEQLIGGPVSYIPPTLTTPSVVSVGDGVLQGNEIDFPITISPPSSNRIILSVSTNGESAKGGTNFTNVGGFVFIPANATTYDATVPIITPAQTDTDFTYAILSAQGAEVGRSTGKGVIPGSGLVAGTFVATAGKPAKIAEGNGKTATFTIKGVGKGTGKRNADGSVQFSFTGTDGKTIASLSATPVSTPKVARLHPSDTTGSIDFQIASITSATPLGTFSAPGADLDGNATFKSISSLTLANAANNNVIKLGSVTNAVVKFGHVATASLTGMGSIKSLAATDWMGGSITATSIGALSTSGDFDADVSVTSLGKLAVGAELGGTGNSDVRTIRAKQSIGAVSAASIAHEYIYAGVKPTIKTLPAARGVFNNPEASITSVTTRGFTDAIAAAPIITKINITGLVSTNATAFGVASERIANYKRDAVIAKNIFSKKKIDTLDQYTASTV
jgi:hypothetical protein